MQMTWSMMKFLIRICKKNYFLCLGFNVNHLDIAPRYATILFGIANFTYYISGKIALYIIERILTHKVQLDVKLTLFFDKFNIYIYYRWFSDIEYERNMSSCRRYTDSGSNIFLHFRFGWPTTMGRTAAEQWTSTTSCRHDPITGCTSFLIITNMQKLIYFKHTHYNTNP